MSDHRCQSCGQHMPPEVRKRSPDEQLAKLLSDITACSINPCRKQIKALRLKDWSHGRIRVAIEKFAEPGDAAWDWAKKAVEKPFRAEPEPERLPDLPRLEFYRLAAKDADMKLVHWLEYHKPEGWEALVAEEERGDD